MSTTALPTAVTFTEGATIGISAQIAADDHTATVTPGTYPLTWDATGRRGVAIIEITTPERRAVAAAIAGRILSTRIVPAETRRHHYTLENWQLPTWGKHGTPPTLTY